MKIDPSKIQVIGTEEQQVKKKDQGQGFDSILTREIQKDASKVPADQSGIKPGRGIAGLNPTLAAQMTSQTQQPPSERTVMQNFDSLLAQWENYADRLDSAQGGQDLKQLYAMLEGIVGSVSNIKEQWAGLEQKPEQLGALINELEIMAVTEQIKFNRGDYLE